MLSKLFRARASIKKNYKKTRQKQKNEKENHTTFFVNALVFFALFIIFAQADFLISLS